MCALYVWFEGLFLLCFFHAIVYVRSVCLIGGTISALYFSREGVCALCMSDWRDYFCSVFFTRRCMCALYVWLEGLFLLCTFHAVVYLRSVCLIGGTISALYFLRCRVCALCMSDWRDYFCSVLSRWCVCALCMSDWRDYFCSVLCTLWCMCAWYVWLEALFLPFTFHAKVYVRAVCLIGGTISALYFSRYSVCALCMSDLRDYFCSVLFTLWCMCALYVWLDGLLLPCTFHAKVYVRAVHECLIGGTISALYFSRYSVYARCMSDWRGYFCPVLFTL